MDNRNTLFLSHINRIIQGHFEMTDALISYVDSFGETRYRTPEGQAFNDACKAYKEKFGVSSVPLGGIGVPDITTELLLEAVAKGKEIEMLPIPYGAVS
jgi:hypothetical protein